MAQLKDTVVQGSLRATDNIYATNIILSGSQTAKQVLAAPASENGAPSWRTLTGADVGLGNVDNSTYAGGTAVTLNGTSKASSTASFYAPTTSGTANQILVSGGANTAPSWKATANGAAYATSANGALTFGTLPIAQGGTNLTSITQGGIIYAASTTAYGSTAAGTSGQYLKSNGTSAPTWATFEPATVGLGNVTNDAQVKASVGTAKGDMIYFTASATPARLAIGTAGYTLQATANGPVWTETVSVANGGTGATSFTANSAVVSGNSTTAALTTRGILNNTSAGALGWNSGGNTNADNLRFMTVNTLAYWNGCYSSTSSNLEYGKLGKFGNMSIKTVGTGFSDSSNTLSVSYGTIADTALQGNQTLVTLNGTNKTAASVASFYAPTSAGSAGQVLVSSGDGAPTWSDNATSIMILAATRLDSGGDIEWTDANITADHYLIKWNFSSSPENAPPVGLTWTTTTGKLTVTVTSGTSSETISPILMKIPSSSS